jgi:hypothetical protein
MKFPRRLEAVDRYPPVSVWDECDAAGRRADELREEGLELSFVTDGAGGDLLIELRGLDGTVLRTVPVGQAVRIAAGESPHACPPG